MSTSNEFREILRMSLDYFLIFVGDAKIRNANFLPRGHEEKLISIMFFSKCSIFAQILIRESLRASRFLFADLFVLIAAHIVYDFPF